MVYSEIKSFDFDVIELTECACLVFLHNLFTIHS